MREAQGRNLSGPTPFVLYYKLLARSGAIGRRSGDKPPLAHSQAVQVQALPPTLAPYLSHTDKTAPQDFPLV